MPNDNREPLPLTIEEVAQPWYVRHQGWLVAGAVAGGLIALGRLRNKSTSFDSNPLQDKDEWWQLRPMVIGQSAQGAPGEDEARDRILSHWWEINRLSWGRSLPEKKEQQVTDAIVQLYNALGKPVWIEGFDIIPLWLEKIGPNILNVKWLIEEAKTSKKAFRHLWYAIKIPELTVLSPDDQQQVFEIIDRLPKRERWRVKFFYDQFPIHIRGTDRTPRTGRQGQTITDYHASYIDTPRYSLLKMLELPYKEFVGAVAGDTSIAWQEVHDRIPNETKLLQLSPLTIAHFDKKTYLRALRYLKKQPGLQDADRVRGAIGLTLTFGPDWKDWLVELKNKGVTAHDATFWLPQTTSPGLGAFLRRRIREKDTLTVDDFNNFTMISDQWNDLPEPVKRDTTAHIIEFITSAIYEDIKDPRFAIEAARWGTKEEDYKEMENRWLKATATRMMGGDTIPYAEVTSDDLKLFKLDRDDPRGLFLGKHTACCQAPGLEGEKCAWHGVESPNAAFFVIENELGDIVAQAWTWRNHDVVMFDNIEGDGVQSSKTRDQVIGMYKELAKELLKVDPTILEVRIGTTEDKRKGDGSIIDWSWDAPRAWPPDGAELIPPPLDFLEAGGDYTDSADVQFILAKRGEGTKYFRSSEYMDFLVSALKETWNNNEKDAFEFIAKAVKASPFTIELNQNEEKHPRLDWRMLARQIDVYADINLCLYDRKARKYKCAFTFQVKLVAKIIDLERLGIEWVKTSDWGRTETKEEMLDAILKDKDVIDQEIDAVGIVDDAIDIPDEKFFTFDAKYLVAVNMEIFKGYDKKEDAEKVEAIYTGIFEDKDFAHNTVSILRKLDEEEIKEYEEDGTLEDKCYELQEDEWWCLEY